MVGLRLDAAVTVQIVDAKLAVTMLGSSNASAGSYRKPNKASMAPNRPTPKRIFGKSKANVSVKQQLSKASPRIQQQQ